MSLARYTVEELLTELRSRTNLYQFEALMGIISEVFNVKREKLLAYCNEKHESEARIAAMSIASHYYSLQRTAELFCRKDHSTVHYAKRRCQYYLQNNPIFAHKFNQVEERFLREVTKQTTNNK